jgi:hypothetical protein
MTIFWGLSVLQLRDENVDERNFNSFGCGYQFALSRWWNIRSRYHPINTASGMNDLSEEIQSTEYFSPNWKQKNVIPDPKKVVKECLE